MPETSVNAYPLTDPLPYMCNQKCSPGPQTLEPQRYKAYSSKPLLRSSVLDDTKCKQDYPTTLLQATKSMTSLQIPPVPTTPAPLPPTKTLQLSLSSLSTNLQVQPTFDQHIDSMAHNYTPPTPGTPTPTFNRGCDRFPAHHRRWFQAESAKDSSRYEEPAGVFDEESYCSQWNSGRSIWVQDIFILSIQQEKTQAGIQYQIMVHPQAWRGQVLLRGNAVTFRGFEPLGNIRYILTWEVSKVIWEGKPYAYI